MKNDCFEKLSDFLLEALPKDGNVLVKAARLMSAMENELTRLRAIEAAAKEYYKNTDGHSDDCDDRGDSSCACGYRTLGAALKDGQ